MGPFCAPAVRCHRMLRLLRFGTRNEVQRDERVDPLRVLASSAASGDSRAQRTLFVELGPSLLRTARAILGAQHPEVEDVLQESMVALVAALPRFRGECTTRHFASRVAVQTALNVRRRTRLRAKYVALTPDEELDDVASPEASPAERSDSARRKEILRELLCKLPEIHAEVLAMHVVLGCTVEETSLTLGVPPNTVRSRLRRGLTTLRDSIQGDAIQLEILGDET
jgi:RNA polymerase sigma factor (sigma-70 family)